MKNEIIFVTWSRFERFLKTKLAVKMIKLPSQCLLSFVLHTRLKGTKLLLYLLLSRFMTNSAGFASQPSRGDFHVRSKFFVLKSRACSSKEGDPPCPALPVASFLFSQSSPMLLDERRPDFSSTDVRL